MVIDSLRYNIWEAKALGGIPVTKYLRETIERNKNFFGLSFGRFHSLWPEDMAEHSSCYHDNQETKKENAGIR